MARKIADEIEQFCLDRKMGLSIRDVAIKNNYSPTKFTELLYQGEKDLEADLNTPYRKFFVQWHMATVELKVKALMAVSGDKFYINVQDILAEEKDSDKSLVNEILVEKWEAMKDGTKAENSE